MTSRDFCYWLQGFFEIDNDPGLTLGVSQVQSIKKHLALVFAHEIDPSQGDEAHQAILNEIHNPPQNSHMPMPFVQQVPGKPLMRC